MPRTLTTGPLTAWLLEQVSDDQEQAFLRECRRQIYGIQYGERGSILAAKERLESVQGAIKSDLGQRVWNALKGGLESMRGRWIGQRSEIEKGSRSVRELVDFLEDRSREHQGELGVLHYIGEYYTISMSVTLYR